MKRKKGERKQNKRPIEKLIHVNWRWVEKKSLVACVFNACLFVWLLVCIVNDFEARNGWQWFWNSFFVEKSAATDEQTSGRANHRLIGRQKPSHEYLWARVNFIVYFRLKYSNNFNRLAIDDGMPLELQHITCVHVHAYCIRTMRCPNLIQHAHNKCSIKCVPKMCVCVHAHWFLTWLSLQCMDGRCKMEWNGMARSKSERRTKTATTMTTMMIMINASSSLDILFDAVWMALKSSVCVHYTRAHVAKFVISKCVYRIEAPAADNPIGF